MQCGGPHGVLYLFFMCDCFGYIEEAVDDYKVVRFGYVSGLNAEKTKG